MPFTLLGVVDLRDGQAVRARGGQRDRYQAVATIAGEPITPGDAVALAEAYRDRLGLHEIYVADLDAIMTGVPQDAIVSRLASLGVPLWLDAGVSSVDDARRALDAGATRVVIGLETLPSFEILDRICTDIGGDRVAFSLDLRGRQPLVAAGNAARETPQELARRAAGAGAGSLIVLDLARVGMSVGLDLDLIADVRCVVPGLTLLAGGGARGWEDLVALRNAGCDGALIATALHNGSITASQVAAAQVLGPGPST